jgi:hypothetical protein
MMIYLERIPSMTLEDISISYVTLEITFASIGFNPVGIIDASGLVRFRRIGPERGQIRRIEVDRLQIG